MRHARILALLFAACGGSSSLAETPRVVAPTCASTAEHMVDFLASQQDPKPADGAMNPLIALIRTRCEEDRWTSEAQTCLRAMKTAQDADTCGTLLTEAQQAALVRDQEAMLGASGKADTRAKEEGRRGNQAPVPAIAPKPSPDAVPSTSGTPPRAPAKTADPCDGGE